MVLSRLLAGCLALSAAACAGQSGGVSVAQSGTMYSPAVDAAGWVSHTQRATRPGIGREPLLMLEAGVPFDGCILSAPVSYAAISRPGASPDCSVTLASLRGGTTQFTGR